jgi:BirA family biotin operon repressor/biotin-[acetyl-CoA-carboxylase] ligase
VAFGQPRIDTEVTESTQLLLDESMPEGSIAVADEQTAGRGRLGRRWLAPRGTSVMCSVLLRPPAERSRPQLSLVGGLAAAEAVEGALGRPVQIKWPNDVMVDGRKVAGVLAESRGEIVVLGIGINVNQSADELPPPGASLLTIDGAIREREPILRTLLERLELHYGRWRDGGLDALHDALAGRDFLRGRRVTVDGVGGTAVGIDRLGRLEVDVGGEVRPVESGEVTYR